MKKLIVFFLFAFISSTIYSQGPYYVGDNFMNKYRNAKINTSKNSLGENIAGSPFTTDDFVLGTVIGYKNDFLLRYDAFSDQMLIKNKDGNVVIVNKETTPEVTFNDGAKYVVFDYTFDGAEKNGYLEVLLSNSETSLLKKAVVKFYPAEKPASGYDRPKPATFKKGRDRYLISDKNNKVRAFSKKKEFLNLFPDKKKNIEEFIKSNKIKFTNEKDLIKLIEYINTSI